MTPASLSTLSEYFDRADRQVLHLENENWQLRQRVRVAEERLGANSPKLAANASMTPASLSNLSSATRTRCRSCQFEQDHLPSECAYEPLSEYFDRADRQVLHLENENWQPPPAAAVQTRPNSPPTPP
jgi:hypothetical protein